MAKGTFFLKIQIHFSIKIKLILLDIECVFIPLQPTHIIFSLLYIFEHVDIGPLVLETYKHDYGMVDETTPPKIIFALCVQVDNPEYCAGHLASLENFDPMLVVIDQVSIRLLEELFKDFKDPWVVLTQQTQKIFLRQRFSYSRLAMDHHPASHEVCDIRFIYAFKDNVGQGWEKP
jgi:hypothetical protein